MNRHHLLLVDDDKVIVESINRKLESLFKIFIANSKAEAFSLLQNEKFSLIVCDANMNNGEGLEILIQAYKTNPFMARIMLSAYQDIRLITEAINKAHITTLILKPFDFDKFEKILNNELSLYESVTKKEELFDQLKRYREELVESRGALKKVNALEPLINQNEPQLKILLIDPIQSDTDTINEILIKANFFFDLQTFDSKVELKNENLRKTNLILFNFKYDAKHYTKFFNYFQKKIGDIPVILLAKPGTDEVAWMSKELSSFDYIPKTVNALERLPIIIEQTNEKSMLKKNLYISTQKLVESEARYRSIASELFELNKELFEKNEQLKVVNNLKNEFLSSISHELRTPLTAIIGFTEILLKKTRDQLPENYYKFIKRIERNSNNLLYLINNLLDLSKIEAGKMEVTIEDFTLSELINEVKQLVQGLLIDSQVQFKLNVQSENEILSTDYKKLFQIIVNLVGNAIKFTEEGFIEFGARLNNGNLFLEIRDSGIGIREEEIQFLFDSFKQVGNTRKTKASGTGLGLSISKKMVNLLKGDISVSSIFGKGTTFNVIVPQNYYKSEIQPEVDSKETAEEGFKKNQYDLNLPTVLLFSGDSATLSILKNLLTEYNLRVINESESSKLLEALTVNQPICTFLDISYLKDLNLVQIVNSPVHLSKFIILSNAHIDISSLPKRIINFFQKPISIKEIKFFFENYFFEKPSIFIIDDEEKITKAYSRVLAKKGYEVRASNNSENALRMLQAFQPDIICLDLNMDGMTGYEMLADLKKDQRLSKIPVVIITGKFLDENEYENLSEKTVSIIFKNEFKIEIFEKVILSNLKRKFKFE